MNNKTRILFTAFVSKIALLSGVASAAEKFTVSPVVAQKLEERIQQSSEFLSRIQVVPVDQQEGDKVGVGVTRPIASRTNTAAGTRRTPTDPTDTSNLSRYRCEQTNFDHAIKYAKLDAWAHRPEFQTLLRDVIVKQQARDRIMIGWNGTAVAATTDLSANPLLQDVNKGWLYKIRTDAPSRVLSDGALTPDATKAIYVSDTTDKTKRDYVTLDALAFDAIELLDEWHRDDTDLVVIVGRNLLQDKYANLYEAAANTPTQVEARDRILTLPKQIAGKTAIVVPFFPANSLLITRLDNLSIYVQNGTRRRLLKDEPALDQIENYESVNEAYVVEDYGSCGLVENIVMGPKP